MLSVAAGAAIGLTSGVSERAVAPVRTFAFVAASVVVFAQLLPEAIGEIGLAAIAVFGAALALPAALERAAHRRHGSAHRHGEDAADHALGLELGYGGLLLHNFGDGLGVGAFSGPLHTGHAHLDLTLSVAAHTVPVTALFVVAFAAARGTRSAVRRAIGLALAMAAGFALAGVLPEALARPWAPWIGAAVAGLLLHVIAHDWPRPLLTSRSQRALEILAVAAGLSMALLGDHAGDELAADAAQRAAVGVELLGLALQIAPLLLAGLAAGALVESLGGRRPPRSTRRRSALADAVAGLLLGAVRAGSRGDAVPAARRLAARGGRPALVVAFLLGAPALGAETLALTIGFFSWQFALLRLAAAALGALVAALVAGVLARDAQEPRPAPEDADELDAPPSHRALGPLPAGLLAHFEALADRTAPWLIAGILAAAYARIALAPDALASLSHHGLDVLLISLAALPARASAAGLVPLAAALVSRGLSPGTALAGLVLLPAGGPHALAFLRRTCGPGGAAVAFAGLIGVAWLADLGAGRLPPGLDAGRLAAADSRHGLMAHVALAVLLGFVARGVWRHGLRAWLGSLGHGPAPVRSSREAR